MDLKSRSAALKAKLAAELPEAHGDQERWELLLAALYEMSRAVLPALGPPLRSTDYAEKQGAVLELVSFIAIPMIRSATRDTRGVAVLTEIAEGCSDPLIKKKLKVYSQQLLAGCTGPKQRTGHPLARRAAWGGGVALALLTGVLIWPGQAPEQPQPTQAVAVPRQAALPAPMQPALPGNATGAAASFTLQSGKTASGDAASAGTGTEAGQNRAESQITKVAVVNNQILVPALIQNGAESIRVELVLDTGATRSSIHEGVAAKLKIDLKTAHSTLAEVADGRLINALRAPVDALSVGPFTMNGPELDVLPYRGSQGLHDGLLGMDFLSKHPYQVDMERELIRWN
ncbi:hypothetical protein GMST_10300 [Geomonas silvestris]|uniref:Peptidase n=1 Tax=Geomonas silvestris TaxID=2740184 RepID=A0A6V8MFE1_9BACT|nr:retropepsin-like aspartic protease [Geomonas silvestris]GFO58705.1 hypothetical protein GMST_10300 [Geomonas silvestris]